jgi:hypothetical protein
MRFNVSVPLDGFVNVEVEASSEREAKAKVLAARKFDVNTIRFTDIREDDVEVMAV